MCSKLHSIRCFWCFIITFLITIVVVQSSVHLFLYYKYSVPTVDYEEPAESQICPLLPQKIPEYIAVYKFGSNGIYATNKTLVYSSDKVNIWPTDKVTDEAAFSKLLINNKASLLSLNELSEFTYIDRAYLESKGFDKLLIKPIIKDNRLLTGVLLAGVKSGEHNPNLEYLLSIPQRNILPLLANCK